MNGPELKPCPLCGGRADYLGTSQVRGAWATWGFDALGYTVVCTECGCTVPSGMSVEEVALRWNRRDG